MRYDVSKCHETPSAMILPDGVTLLATVCNTVLNATPYALWFARKDEEYLVDLSDTLSQQGDIGLTGLTSIGDKLYAAVQSSTKARIVVLDRRLNVVNVIASPEFVDLHSLHRWNESLIAVSTGNQSVFQLDLADQRIKRLCAFDAMIHANSAWPDETGLLICCHSPAHLVPEATGGGVINVTTRRVILDRIGYPHSLEPNGNGFLVLDSHGQRVIRFNQTGIRQEQVLSGFLRGIAASRGSLFVASSPVRQVSRKNPVASTVHRHWDVFTERVCIHELDDATLAVKTTHFPLVAGFEIYELLALDGAEAIDPAPSRLISSQAHVLARMYYEAAKNALAAPR